MEVDGQGAMKQMTAQGHNVSPPDEVWNQRQPAPENQDSQQCAAQAESTMRSFPDKLKKVGAYNVAFSVHWFKLPRSEPILAHASEFGLQNLEEYQGLINRYEQNLGLNQQLRPRSQKSELVQIHFGPPARNGDENGRKMHFGLTWEMGK